MSTILTQRDKDTLTGGGMTGHSNIFDTHYQDYCSRISNIDLMAIRDRLLIEVDNRVARIRFFNTVYQVSGAGITDSNNRKPDYVTSIILFKYLLHCPDQLYIDEAWCTLTDFKKDSHFTNTNSFNSDTTGRIISHFSERLSDLKTAATLMNGQERQLGLSYDLCISFTVLPRLSLLLLANDADEEFPADCNVLFQKQGEYYLDPESLIMTSGLLAQKLITADKERKCNEPI